MTRPRVAIYACYSTDLQNSESCNDQARECEKLVLALNGVLVDKYLDPAESGYKRDRPELERLLRDVALKRIDVVLAESIDRLARDPEGLHFIGKMLECHGVALHTVTEGIVDGMKIAVVGLIGSIFLPNLRAKVRRGLAAVVESGRTPAKVLYGYRKVVAHDASGNVIPGLREIDPDKAAIVRRIFRDFANGQSAVQIAKGLNSDGIPGPRGGEWNPATIRGDPKKLDGILNNPMYVGKLVWQRSEWRKNPDSVRRERRPRRRDPSEWIEKDIPALRIVDDELWNAVRDEMRRRECPKLTAVLAHRNRRRHLL